MREDKCANCGCYLPWSATSGESSIYSPGEPFTLCEPCFFGEEDLIEERGTNVIPERIEHYRATLARND